jgi:hypothetical protein
METVTDNRESVEKVLLLEYEYLKKEQVSRIRVRDNLLYATLVALAAVLAAVINAHGQFNFLLLLPPVSLILGWTYLINDEKISAVGSYIRVVLTPRVEDVIGGYDVFGWETAHRTDARRRLRKILQLVVDLMAFCFLPLAALVTFMVHGDRAAPFVVVWSVELLAILVLTSMFVVYSDLWTVRAQPSAR